MKKLIVLSAILMAGASAFAGGGVNGPVYQHRPVNMVFDNGEQYVWLTSLDQYRGPGRLTDCHAVWTYAGTPGASGPGKGTPRKIYICRVRP